MFVHFKICLGVKCPRVIHEFVHTRVMIGWWKVALAHILPQNCAPPAGGYDMCDLPHILFFRPQQFSPNAANHTAGPWSVSPQTKTASRPLSRKEQTFEVPFATLFDAFTLHFFVREMELPLVWMPVFKRLPFCPRADHQPRTHQNDRVKDGFNTRYIVTSMYIMIRALVCLFARFMAFQAILTHACVLNCKNKHVSSAQYEYIRAYISKS